MKKYAYKNILCFQVYGCWHADYIKNGKCFAIHRSATRTKAKCYEIAKAEIDYLNEKEENEYGTQHKRNSK